MPICSKCKREDFRLLKVNKEISFCWECFQEFYAKWERVDFNKDDYLKKYNATVKEFLKK